MTKLIREIYSFAWYIIMRFCVRGVMLHAYLVQIKTMKEEEEIL